MTSRIACCRRVRPVFGSGSSVTLGRPGPRRAGSGVLAPAGRGAAATVAAVDFFAATIISSGRICTVQAHSISQGKR